MSPRLIIAVASAAIIVIGAGIVTWVLVERVPTPMSGSGAAATKPASEIERREYREQFFGGDPDRGVRGGQEMKPRW